MKSKSISILVSIALLTNMSGFSALAQDANLVDESLIDQSLAAQNNELKRNLAQVNVLINSIQAYRTSSEGDKQSAIVNKLRVMVTLLGLASTALFFKSEKAQSSIELTLAAVMGALSTTLGKYAETQKIDMEEIRRLLAENQKDLINSLDKVNQQDAALIAGAVAQLSQISDSIDSQMNDIKNTIDSGQTDIAIVAVITLVLHSVTPFLPNKLKEIVLNKASTLVGHAVKTKTQSMWALGGTNVATLLATVAGMAGKDSKVQLDSILANLRVTQANLAAAVKK